MISPTPIFKPFNFSQGIEWPADHVFIIPVNEYFDSIKNSFHSVLSDKECQKAICFSRAEDQKSYIVRKHFTRDILAILSKKDAKEIIFEFGRNKKPIVKSIPFNTSHSANLVAFALSSGEVGVDVEYLKEDFSYQIMLNDCFNAAEQIEITKSADPLYNFYVLWTRKEALLKANGAGINDYNLNEIDVRSALSSYADQTYKIYSSIIFERYALSTAWASNGEKINYWTLPT